MTRNPDKLRAVPISRKNRERSDRTLLGAFAIFTAATGMFLLGAPQTFFGNVPGVAATGSFNAHFLPDVGLAYIMLAAGARSRCFVPSTPCPWRPWRHTPPRGTCSAPCVPRSSGSCIWIGATALGEAPRIYLVAALAVVLVVRAASAARRERLRKNSGES